MRAHTPRSRRQHSRIDVVDLWQRGVNPRVNSYSSVWLTRASLVPSTVCIDYGLNHFDFVPKKADVRSETSLRSGPMGHTTDLALRYATGPSTLFTVLDCKTDLHKVRDA